MSIYTPILTDIIYYSDNARISVEKEVARLTTEFMNGNFLPELILLKKLLRKADQITNDRIESMLAANAINGIEKAVEESCVTSLYSDKGVELINNVNRLERVLIFTKWLKESYSPLLDLQICKTADLVWGDFSFLIRGTHINPNKGLLYISLQDECDVNHSSFYTYQLDVSKRLDGRLIYDLNIEPGAYVSKVSGLGHLVETPRGSAETSLIAVKSRVPASPTKIVIPLMMYRLRDDLSYFYRISMNSYT